MSISFFWAGKARYACAVDPTGAMRLSSAGPCPMLLPTHATSPSIGGSVDLLCIRARIYFCVYLYLDFLDFEILYQHSVSISFTIPIDIVSSLHGTGKEVLDVRKNREQGWKDDRGGQ